MISIIMPAYNTEAYISESIDSVLGQTYSDWELLIINDGSTDGTGMICKEYSDRDSRIRYFETENRGQGAARNLGIEESKGEYIIFLDSDDTIKPELIETVFGAISKDGADICEFGYCCINNKNEQIFHVKGIQYQNTVSVDQGKELLGQLCPLLCNRMVRAEAVKDAKIGQDSIIFEDAAFWAKVYSQGLRVCTLEDELYIYRYVREGNLSTQYDRLSDAVGCIDSVVDHYKKTGTEVKFREQLYYIAQDRYRDVLARFSIRDDLLVTDEDKRWYPVLKGRFTDSLEEHFGKDVDLAYSGMRFLLFGSFNLRVIINNIIYEKEQIVRDYIGSSIISQFSDPADPGFISECDKEENEFRKKHILLDFSKEFLNESFEDIDVIVIDLLEEINDLIRLKGDSFITESEFVREGIGKDKELRQRCGVLDDDRLLLFDKAVSRFTEKLKESEKPVIIIENLLCGSHSRYYDVRYDYENTDRIEAINERLLDFYGRLEKELLCARVVKERKLRDNRFTHDEWRYGIKPYYYNDGYYRHAAYEMIGRSDA